MVEALDEDQAQEIAEQLAALSARWTERRLAVRSQLPRNRCQLLTQSPCVAHSRGWRGDLGISLAIMCGIVGYAGHRQALDVVLDGLSRLEYRGYDSAGVAVLADGKLGLGQAGRQARQPGAALAERPLLAGTVGIGHTRWATHGAADRPQRPSAHRLRGHARRGAQRDHRELRRAARRTRGATGTS